MNKVQTYTDADMIRMLRSGNRREENAVISHLYGEVQQSLRLFVLSRKGTKEFAEDVLQTGLVVLLDAVRDKGKDLKNLGGYLTGICKRLWYQMYEQAMRTSGISEKQEAVMENESAEMQLELEGYSDLERLRKCLSKLGEKCQKIFGWRFDNRAKLGWQEIADELGYASVQVPKEAWKRCVVRLKKCFFNEG